MAALLRPLRIEDAPGVLALARSLPEWFNAEGLAAMERDLARHRGFLAEEGGRLAGFATWCPAVGDAAAISWMGVSPDRHRRGIGTALLEAVAGDARRAGFAALEVATVADSCAYEPYERTRRFYRARGFADHRVDREFYGTPGDRYDRLVLRRGLAEPLRPEGTA